MADDWAVCSIADCQNRRHSRGWCLKHYTRWRRHGDPNHVEFYWREPERRFWQNVDRTDTCWFWTGYLDKTGYGQFNIGRRHERAHRWSYEHFVGPITAGLDLDHLCRVPACVNPAHLEPVTRAENVKRGLNGDLKTHCAKGHPWVPENIYFRRDRPGQVQCRVCNTVRNRARYQRASS